MARLESNKQDFLFGSHFFSCESGSYFERTSRPIYAIMYLLFFIVVYEVAVFFMSPDLLTRPLDEIPGLVVAFAWIHSFLTWLGLSSQSAWVGAPMVFIIVLVAMQITSRSSYSIRVKDFFPMTLECLGWAIPLIVFGILFGRVARPAQYSMIDATSQTQKVVSLAAQESTDNISQMPKSNLTMEIVTGIGAGIYEELIFRLILIWLLMILFKDLLGFSSSASVLYAILISSFLFSLHHHFYFLDGHIVRSERLVPIIFLFRMLAGVYLSVIFAFRGIGISAATHVYHNIIVALLNSYLFSVEA